MKRHVQCAGQHESASNSTKNCACHAKRISWLIGITYETSLTTREASKVTLQPHQVLRLPRNSEFKIWARNPLNRFRQQNDDSRIIRTESEHKIVISHPPLRRPYSSDLGDDFVLKKQHFPLRLSPKMSQNAAPATKSQSTFSINTAPATKTHTPPSPLTAPATKNAVYSSLLYSLLASILTTHLFSLGIYSLLASILSWHLFSLRIYSPLASILSWLLFSLRIYSLLASILSWHPFSLGIYSLYAFKHLFSLGIYSLRIYSLSFLKLRSSEVSHPNFLWLVCNLKGLKRTNNKYTFI